MYPIHIKNAAAKKKRIDESMSNSPIHKFLYTSAEFSASSALRLLPTRGCLFLSFLSCVKKVHFCILLLQHLPKLCLKRVACYFTPCRCSLFSSAKT